MICRGVDPNRNFGYNWMLNRGASQIKSSNNYAGPKPFSEPEMQALVDFYSTISNQVDAYIGFHSALTMLLYPYGHSLEPAANADILNDIGRATVDELQRVHGTVYELGSVATTFGKNISTL